MAMSQWRCTPVEYTMCIFTEGTENSEEPAYRDQRVDSEHEVGGGNRA